MKMKFFASAALMPIMLLPAAAYAQGTTTDPAPETGQQADSSAGEIIVTATRREESLQKVPVAVTAVSSQTLTTAGVENVRSLNLVAPGYTLAHGDPFEGLPTGGLLELVRDLINFAYRHYIAEMG